MVSKALCQGQKVNDWGADVWAQVRLLMGTLLQTEARAEPFRRHEYSESANGICKIKQLSVTLCYSLLLLM